MAFPQIHCLIGTVLWNISTVPWKIDRELVKRFLIIRGQRYYQKQPPEVFCEKVLLKIPQNSQENTSVLSLFFNKFAGLRPSRDFFYRTPPFKRLFYRRLLLYYHIKTSQLILQQISCLIYNLMRTFSVKGLERHCINHK